MDVCLDVSVVSRHVCIHVRSHVCTDPPRILEPGKWGSKVRGLAHVQGYRGPQGYVGSKNKVPVPNLSTASRLGRFQVPNLSTSSRFFKHFIFRFLWAAKRR